MLVEYSIATLSEYKDKALKIAARAFGDPDSPPATGRTGDPVQPLGLIARPLDPDADSTGAATTGAGLLTYEAGHELFTAPTTDPRALAGIPPLDKGDTALYSSGKDKVAFILMRGSDGGLLILTPSNEANKSHAISIDPTGNSIQVRHKDGMGIAITGGGKNSTVINNKAGDAYLEVNDDGVIVNGNTNLNGGVAMGPGSVAVALSTELAALKAHIAGLQAPPGANGGPLVVTVPPPPTPGSSKLSAAL